jgi:hypothetical protein
MEPLQGSFTFCYKAMAIKMKPLRGIVAMGVTSRCKAMAIEMKPLWGVVAMGMTSRCKAVAVKMKPLRGVGAWGWRQNIFGRRHNKKGPLQLT